MRPTRSSVFDNPIPLRTVASTAFRDAARRGPMRRIVRALRWLALLPGRIAANRRELAQLGGMSDQELADIGLGRHDLRDATALPVGEAPGVFFQRRVDERRRSRSSSI